MKRTNNLSFVRNLIYSLILFGKIKTAKPQAMAVKALVDNLVTKMKKKTLAGRRQVFKVLPKEEIVIKLEKEILPKLAGRISGYLKTTKVENRLGDNTAQISLEWATDTNLSNLTNLPKKEISVKTDKTK